MDNIGFFFESSSGLGHEYAASAATPTPSSFLQLYQQATPVIITETVAAPPKIDLNNVSIKTLGAVLERMENIMTRLEAFEQTIATQQQQRQQQATPVDQDTFVPSSAKIASTFLSGAAASPTPSFAAARQTAGSSPLLETNVASKTVPKGTLHDDRVVKAEGALAPAEVEGAPAAIFATPSSNAVEVDSAALAVRRSGRNASSGRSIKAKPYTYNGAGGRRMQKRRRPPPRGGYTTKITMTNRQRDSDSE